MNEQRENKEELADFIPALTPEELEEIFPTPTPAEIEQGLLNAFRDEIPG